jgi:hypothetical protein
MKYFLILLATLLLTVNSFGAMFGKDEKIHVIEPELIVPFIAANGVPFVDDFGAPITGQLAYLTETQFFFAGAWITDKGYVIKGGMELYYPILPEERLNIEHEIGSSFPSYQISVLDYLFGYSLWLILGSTIFYYFFKWGIQRMRGEET